ncbi:MAG: glutathione peroxidase [Bacteroidota bacterium]|jgi:glutathione peroxidase
MILRIFMLLFSSAIPHLHQTNFYNLTFSKADGSEFVFSSLKGKVVLIVNTASGCGFSPQYRDLQKLYEKYNSLGFEILAFPSDDFGGQEPLNNKQILTSCSADYGVSFPIFSKSNVKGKNANPVFAWLNSPTAGKAAFSKPYWNFQKFLIDKNGKLVKSFLPFVSPSSKKLDSVISELLSKQATSTSQQNQANLFANP